MKVHLLINLLTSNLYYQFIRVFCVLVIEIKKWNWDEPIWLYCDRSTYLASQSGIEGGTVANL